MCAGGWRLATPARVKVAHAARSNFKLCTLVGCSKQLPGTRAANLLC